MIEDTSYPALRVLLRFGKPLAWLAGLSVSAAGLWAGAAGPGWVWGAAGVAGGALLVLLLLSYCELLRIIADTLLPQ